MDNPPTDENHDDMEPTASHDLQGPPHYLYFLESAAHQGPLAGLFKLGIADSFALRHQQLRHTWGAFHLAGSALLRGASRRQVRALELALRHLFSDPDVEASARMKGQVLSSADFAALGSWRRYPGKQAPGYTEFYDVGCLNEMLAFVEDWRRYRGERGRGLYLQRGLTPADCSLRVGLDGKVVAQLTREERLALRAQRAAEREQEHDAIDAAIYTKMSQALALATEFEEYLVWVDLERWRWARSIGERPCACDRLVEFYFRDLSAEPAQAGATLEPRLAAAQTRFLESFERIEPSEIAWSEDRHQRRLQQRLEDRQRVCYLQEPPHRDGQYPERPFCEDKLRLRLRPQENSPAYPLWPQYEALSRRVEGRRGYEQPPLC